MTLTGNNAITLRKLTSKLTAEKGIPPLRTPWPTKIPMPFLSSSDNFLEYISKLSHGAMAIGTILTHLLEELRAPDMSQKKNQITRHGPGKSE